MKNNCDLLHSMLAQGFYPILNGDLVLDLSKGCGIISSDTIAEVCSLVFIICLLHLKNLKAQLEVKLNSYHVVSILAKHNSRD